MAELGENIVRRIAPFGVTVSTGIIQTCANENFILHDVAICNYLDRLLATVSQGSFFGELAFIDNEARSADVEAKWDSDLYVLSRRRFDECSRTDPNTGAVVFERLAKTIALRLRDTNVALSD